MLAYSYYHFLFHLELLNLELEAESDSNMEGDNGPFGDDNAETDQLPFFSSLSQVLSKLRDEGSLFFSFRILFSNFRVASLHLGNAACFVRLLAQLTPNVLPFILNRFVTVS